MAGKLTFLLTLEGIPKAVTDLRQFQEAIKQLGGVTGGGLGGGLGNVAQGAKAVAASVQAIGPAAAKASASMGKMTQVAQAAFKNVSPDFLSKNPNLAAMLSGAASGKGKPGGISQESAMLNLSAQRALFSRMNYQDAVQGTDVQMRGLVKHWRALQEANRANAPVDPKMAAMGLAASFVSPWIGARAMNSSGVTAPLHKLLGIGGSSGGGGLFGKLMGAGGFGGFMVDFVLLNAVVKGARLALDEFTNALKRGSDLFVKAAMLGTSAGNLSHIQKVFQAVGLPASAAEKLMASGQFSRGNKMDLNGILLGQGQGVLSREEMQGIFNLSKEIESTWYSTASAARQSANISRALFRENLGMARLKIEWQTTWEHLAAAAAPLINTLDEIAIGFLKFHNLLFEAFEWLKSLSINSLLPHTGIKILDAKIDEARKMAKSFVGGAVPGTTNEKFGGVGMQGQFNSWQRMGFVFQGLTSRGDYARQTAENTAKLVKLMTNNPNLPTTVRNPDTHIYDSRYNMP